MKLNFSSSLIFFCMMGLYLNHNSRLACKREIVESYGLVSYDEGKKERLLFCPHIQFTCCPAYEQVRIFKFYQTEKKPGFILLHEVLTAEIDKLEKLLTNVFKNQLLTKAIQGVSNKPMQTRLLFENRKLRKFRPEHTFEKLKAHMKESSSYVAALKSSFYCGICDLQNHSFIDLEKKTISLSSGFCDLFVQKTIIFAHLLNNILVKVLSSVLEMAFRLKIAPKYQHLSGFKRLSKAIEHCAEDYKLYDHGLGKCKIYCEYFNPATDNPFVEGYPEFFANALVSLKAWVPAEAAKKKGEKKGSKDSKAKSVPPKRRLFESSKLYETIKTQQAKNKKVFNENIKEQQLGFLNKMRILKEHIFPKSLENAQKEHKLLGKKRILKEKKKKDDKSESEKEFTTDFFDPSTRNDEVIDILEWDPSDEAKTNQMVEIQNAFASGGPDEIEKAFLRTIQNTVVEIDDIDSLELFKEKSTQKYDLNEFKKVVKFAGVNLDTPAKTMDFNLSQDQILMAFSTSGSDDIEFISDQTVEFINAVNEKDIKNIHQNQLLTFREHEFRTFNETVGSLVEEFALEQLKLMIAQNMILYEGLVRRLKHDSALHVWENIEALNEQIEGLAVGSNKVTVNLITSPETQKQGLLIVSGQNQTGFVNLTKINDIQQVISSYRSSTKKVKMDEVFGVMKNSTDVNEQSSILSPTNQGVQRKLKLLTRKIRKSRSAILKKKNYAPKDTPVSHREVKKEVQKKTLKILK